ncbi:hypothetical protein FBY03_14515, partial [Pseudomonas sp. SJZ079]
MIERLDHLVLTVADIDQTENHLAGLPTSEVAQNSRCEHCLLLKEAVMKF